MPHGQPSSPDRDVHNGRQVNVGQSEKQTDLVVADRMRRQVQRYESHFLSPKVTKTALRDEGIELLRNSHRNTSVACVLDT